MKEDNILLFEGLTSLDIPVERVLRGAELADLKRVIVIGDTEDELYLASSFANTAELVYMLEQIKFKLLHGDYSMPDEILQED